MTTLRIDTEDRKILKAVRVILESLEVPFEEVQSEWGVSWFRFGA